MNTLRQARLALCTAALFFAGSALVAQSTASKQATPHRDTATGVATGRRMHQPLAAASQPSTGTSGTPASGDAQAYYAKHRAQMGSAQSNPMYQEKKTSGENPLFEAKDRSAQPAQHSDGSTHEVIEYKDGDDPVVRRHPTQAAERKSGSIIVLDKNGQQAASRKDGAVVAADFNHKASSRAKQPAPPATTSPR